MGSIVSHNNQKNISKNHETPAMSFSPEILELIFIHLDHTSLKACMEVSKYFRSCVLTSPNVMKKLPLRITSRNWKSKVPFLKHHGDKVKTIELKWNNGSCVYLKFLHFTPMVSRLHLDLTDMGTTKARAAADGEIVELIDAFSELNEGIDLNLDDQLDFGELRDFQCRVYRGDPGAIIGRMTNVRHLRSLNVHSSIESQFDYDSLVDLVVNQRDLRVLELKVERIDKVFTEETVEKMKFQLKKLTLVPASFDDLEYKWINVFLASQARCLEELRVFSWTLQDKIGEGICGLEGLKRMTTHCLPAFFESKEGDTNCVVMKNLTHLR
jgi:hypothetical protein